MPCEHANVCCAADFASKRLITVCILFTKLTMSARYEKLYRKIASFGVH